MPPEAAVTREEAAKLPSSGGSPSPGGNGEARERSDFREKGKYAPDPHRLLPQSQDAELGVLSSILLSPREVMGECIEKKIEPEHFYIPAHAIIYRTVREMYDKAQPIDVILLTQLLRDRQELEKVGGAAFVTSLFTFIPTAANASFYIEILKEKHTLRQVIITCNEFAQRSYEEAENVDTFLDQVETKIFKIAESRLGDRSFRIKDSVMDALESIEKLYERKGAISGIPTGFTDFDQMTDGLHPSEMIVVAARPSMGKTAFAMNIAEHVALNEKHAVAIYSLEMSSQQLVQRLLCSRAKVNLQKVRDGFLADRDFHNLTVAASKLAESKIFIDDTAGLSILELRAKSRRLKAQHDIQLIVIDYLQLLKSPSKRGQENRQLEISEISSGVKALAKELEIPIIVLAQLNRNPEGRSGNRPRLSDLRESGSIEQDADLVGLLVRHEYYAETDEEREEISGQAELIIAKQRNGPVGDVPLTFLKEFTRFEDRARAPEEA
ncbi:MAG TPA: replicative DNA helicase [Chthoniobacteraceae bacterium]|nr:replicative DNA helicase [Chthoniobacteraceae bacterium]